MRDEMITIVVVEVGGAVVVFLVLSAAALPHPPQNPSLVKDLKVK